LSFLILRQRHWEAYEVPQLLGGFIDSSFERDATPQARNEIFTPQAIMGATDSLAEFKAVAAQKFTVFKGAFKSREGFKYFIETHDTALDQHGHPGSKATWSNEDLDPTPPDKRTWRWWNFVTFYLGLSFGNWTLGSTMIGIGLNWWQSILVIFASQLISSIAMFFNSRCASVYHIGYPVVARSVFGMWGSYYFVGARAALAIIWYGVQRKSSRVMLP
jgi:nucleobase:cation symporter-1, NCS1 family